MKVVFNKNENVYIYNRVINYMSKAWALFFLVMIVMVFYDCDNFDESTVIALLLILLFILFFSLMGSRVIVVTTDGLDRVYNFFGLKLFKKHIPAGSFVLETQKTEYSFLKRINIICDNNRKMWLVNVFGFKIDKTIDQIEEVISEYWGSNK